MTTAYVKLKDFLIRILRLPKEPAAPMGDRDRLKVFRASPNYYRYKLLLYKLSTAFGCILTLVLVVGMLVAANLIGGWSTFLLPAGAVLLILLLIASSVINYINLRLDYELRWYKLTDRSLRVREGVMNVHEMTMTFDNIQNISINQGPLQRYFKISDLQVDSAGGGNSDTQQAGSQFNMHRVYFRGVDNAEEIRLLILNRLKRLKTAGLGDRDDMEKTGMEKLLIPAQAGNQFLDILKDIRLQAVRLHQTARESKRTGRPTAD